MPLNSIIIKPISIQSILYRKKSISKRKPTKKPKKPINYHDLQSDLDYAYDSLASIQVIYHSLKHTYLGCQTKIEQHRNMTRLCDMEKELLIAYDDISLQVTHLKKDLTRIEREMNQLKVDSCSETSSP
ncbi:uncharacterized protein B0P05DRAFT_525094 [Gilbertella persicaria]|uniref:uncharacterized protein n=1 Tax=Gilbertella persicaria TaxID=101096 RepID=UPI00221EB8BD|nr:uncharacterized protein B0P05DRAFT_525094 [Gilbertella persicaria]KAI8092171.1 hypothetical protein B0P05DRAFT_525094 [Gilbertella persicaria]